MDQLTIYRNQIDNLDKEIIKLLTQRFEVVKLVWKYKKDNNIKPLQPWRWQEVLESKKELARKNWLSENFIEIIWNNIHEYALNLEK